MPASGSRPILVPLIVACAMFMQNLDSTVIATALPTIANSLGESPLRLNVAITCYLLSLAVFIPISGWVADPPTVLARAACSAGRLWFLRWARSVAASPILCRRSSAPASFRGWAER